jgi:hypothetical protein
MGMALIGDVEFAPLMDGAWTRYAAVQRPRCSTRGASLLRHVPTLDRRRYPTR